MAISSWFHCGYLPALACLFSVQAWGGVFEPVVYDLRLGSVIVDECLPCDRAPIERSLRGTLVLERLPVRIVGELYSVTAIDLASPASPAGDLEYVVQGSGTYYRNGGDPLLQNMELNLEVNGAAGVTLSTEGVEAVADWPSFSIAVTEDGQRDPFRRYTIRLVAAPRVTLTLYELVAGDLATFKGSFFIDDCRPCGRPTIPVPIAGTFLLGEIAGAPNPISTYRMDEIAFESQLEGQDYRLAGAGIYRQGGEVALCQDIDLVLQVNDDSGAHLASDQKTACIVPPLAFPEVDIELLHLEPASEFHVYSLHIVARPAPASDASFRRGDSNADSGVDISDAIFALLWLFSGGREPSCREAADINGDRRHDLADAVYLLLHLFQSGTAPPAPGPEACGPAPQPVFGCRSYPICGP